MIKELENQLKKEKLFMKLAIKNGFVVFQPIKDRKETFKTLHAKPI